MGVKLQLWNGLKTELAALKTAGTINHYAVWNNQIGHENEEIPFEYPAVFVEFSSIVWDFTGIKPDNRASLNKQIGEMTVTIRMAFEKYVDESTAFEQIEPVIDTVTEKLQYYRCNEYTTPMLRSAERQDTDHDNRIVWEVDFTLAVQETFSQAGQTDATTGGTTTIGLVINKDLDIDKYDIRTS